MKGLVFEINPKHVLLSQFLQKYIPIIQLIGVKMSQSWKLNWDKALLLVAVILIAMGIILILSDDVLGDRTTGIATIFGILGLGLITTRNKRKKKVS